MVRRYSIELEPVITTLQRKTKSTDELDFLITYLNSLPDFRKYLTDKNRDVCRSIVSSMHLEFYQRNSVVFHKGEPSDKFYILLWGCLEAVNVEKNGSLMHFGSVYPGKQVGERGLVRRQPRSLTIRAKEDSYMLALSGDDFQKYLAEDAYVQLERKLQFIEKYFPKINNVTSVHRERIAFNLGYEEYKRNSVLLEKDEMNDTLYFIWEGEVSLNYSTELSARVVTLGPGNCFGEEGALTHKPNYYNVIVLSERALVYSIKRADLKIIPEDTREVWRNNFYLKEKGRRLLMHSTIERMKTEKKDSIMQTDVSIYPQASRYAQRRLKEINLRYSAVSNNRRFNEALSNDGQRALSSSRESKSRKERRLTEHALHTSFDFSSPERKTASPMLRFKKLYRLPGKRISLLT
jgi:CRP-like cAMP-binding protein